MSSPYSKTYEKTSDLSKFFKYDDKNNTMTFTSESLEVRIGQRFETYGYLDIGKTVKTIAICDMIIDETYQASLLLLAKIEIEYSDMQTRMIDGLNYLILELVKGDKFICNTEIIKDSGIIYAVYSDYIGRGNLIYPFTYDNIYKLLDQAKSMCGANLRVDHVILEIIYAHLARDPNNKAVHYRHTDMSQPCAFIPIRSIQHAPSSTTARMIGSYFGDALNSSLLSESSSHHELENLLR